MTIGLLVLFAGYSIGSYGVVLIRGYDITLKQWLDPLDPYQWPAGKVPLVPPGQIFPGAVTPGGPAARRKLNIAERAAQGQGRPDPGSVQSRL